MNRNDPQPRDNPLQLWSVCFQQGSQNHSKGEKIVISTHGAGIASEPRAKG